MKPSCPGVHPSREPRVEEDFHPLLFRLSPLLFGKRPSRWIGFRKKISNSMSCHFSLKPIFNGKIYGVLQLFPKRTIQRECSIFLESIQHRTAGIRHLVKHLTIVVGHVNIAFNPYSSSFGEHPGFVIHAEIHAEFMPFGHSKHQISSSGLRHRGTVCHLP